MRWICQYCDTPTEVPEGNPVWYRCPGCDQMAGGLYDPPPPSPRPEDLVQVELRVATTTTAEIAKLRQFLPELQGRPLSDVLADFAGKDFIILVNGPRYETYHMVERARAAGLVVEEVIMNSGRGSA